MTPDTSLRVEALAAEARCQTARKHAEESQMRAFAAMHTPDAAARAAEADRAMEGFLTAVEARDRAWRAAGRRAS